MVNHKSMTEIERIELEIKNVENYLDHIPVNAPDDEFSTELRRLLKSKKEALAVLEANESNS